MQFLNTHDHTESFHSRSLGEVNRRKISNQQRSSTERTIRIARESLRGSFQLRRVKVAPDFIPSTHVRTLALYPFIFAANDVPRV